MPHPVVYQRDMNALLKEWDDRYKQTWKEQGRAGLLNLKIADGECARLPQELTGVGYTGRWQRGDRVIDVARTLKPGTVIANFVLKDGKMVYPNAHGYHAALFIGGESYSGGKAMRIRMFDQWRGKWPSPRGVPVVPESSLKKPCDRAQDFYVVLVP
jgi:hypothetical protein